MNGLLSPKSPPGRLLPALLVISAGLLTAVFWRRDDLLSAGVRAGFLPADWKPGDASPHDGKEENAGAEETSAFSRKDGKNGAGASTVFSHRGAPAQAGRLPGKEEVAPDSKPGKKDPAGGSDAAPGKSGAEMKEWAARVVALKGKPELKTELELFIGSITAENWRETADSALPLYDFLDPDQWGELMIRLGAAGGQAAAERFKPANLLMEYEGYGSRGAMRGWAVADRAAAQAFLESLPEGRYRDGMGVGFFHAIDEASVASLEKMYDQLPRSLWPQIAATQRDMARWEAAGPDSGVEGWVSRTEAQFGKDSERFRVVQETADLHYLEGAMWHKDSAAVEALTREYFERPGNQTTDRVRNTALQHLGQLDPTAALDLAQDNFAAHPALKQSIPAVISGWTGKDSAGPGNWLNGHSDSVIYDPAVVAYIKSVSAQDPAAAQAWAKTIKSDSLRAATLKQLSK